MAEVGALSESLEDYVEVIYQLVEEKKVARVRDIAARRGVSMSSVVGALRRLSAADLILYHAREFVVMTKAGEELARLLLARHELLTRFFVDILGVDATRGEDEACSLEHLLSPATMRRLRRFSGYVNHYPMLAERFRQLNPPGELDEEGALPDCG